MNMKTLKIKGMHCATCSKNIYNVVKEQNEVIEPIVNYATETLQFQTTEDINNLEIIKTINAKLKPLGYEVYQEEQIEVTNRNWINKDNVINYVTSLISLLVFTLMLVDIIRENLLGIMDPLIKMDITNPILFVIASLILLFPGRKFVYAIYLFVKNKIASMDTLIGIGTLTAYLYSAVITLFPILIDKYSLAEIHLFDITIVVIGFILFGKELEYISKRKTNEALEKLLGMQVKTATIIRNGVEMTISIEEVLKDDLLIIKTGQKIPVDGVIIEGETAIDESMVTGEPLPIDKKLDDKVFAGTINTYGVIKVKATKIGKDTLLSQIVEIIAKAQNSKAPIQNLADKVSEYFVPVVLIIAILTGLIWMTIGTNYLGLQESISYAIICVVGVLAIACPCALGLATPTGIIVGIGKGAENGILIKDAEALQKLANINTVLFDKTGTLTLGKPTVNRFINLSDAKYFKQDFELSNILYLIEKNSDHPLAQALVRFHIEKFSNINNIEESNTKITEINTFPGFGLSAKIYNDKTYFIGKKQFIEENCSINIDKILDSKKIKINDIGSYIYLANKHELLAMIIISDKIKESAYDAINYFKISNIETILLTGDNKKNAEYTASKLNINNVISDVLPADKAKVIEELQNQGKKVLMIGDGLNDAPALAQADVSISMSTGVDIAIETADITVLEGDLRKATKAIKLSRMTIKTIKENLFWAFIFNIIGIPIAAGILYPMWGILLNPMIAGMAMALSSITVISNSLRLKYKKL